jgi:hypothetical protein
MGKKLLIVHKNVVHVSFWEKFLQNFFEIPKPQVASFEELESGSPWGGGRDCAVVMGTYLL